MTNIRYAPFGNCALKLPSGVERGRRYKEPIGIETTNVQNVHCALQRTMCISFFSKASLLTILSSSAAKSKKPTKQTIGIETILQGDPKRLWIVIFSDGPKKFEKCYNPIIFRELI